MAHEVYEEQSIRMRTAKDRKVEENFPTLRDQFAMQTLQTFKWQYLEDNSLEEPNLNMKKAAKICYLMADAMLEARKEKK